MTSPDDEDEDEDEDKVDNHNKESSDDMSTEKESEEEPERDDINFVPRSAITPMQTMTTLVPPCLDLTRIHRKQVPTPVPKTPYNAYMSARLSTTATQNLRPDMSSQQDTAAGTSQTYYCDH
ncbi:hypothetical protein K435DRAFT_865806 [Dendrothele bispora CBS 962.96]|uniref:Uncharacterized protein n=1 Tax=Dendrothele bispora (strain CBS 962.96) TaxID=1314807 RepID=A0A4S8LJ31_DENBC|nr:hypothetical protein K435DRAFT_865806 [Dendrothele bispora CBS 962.96]